jgi:hypothetical protein
MRRETREKRERMERRRGRRGGRGGRGVRGGTGWKEGEEGEKGEVGKEEKGGSTLKFTRLYSVMKELLPAEEIFEDYLHPDLFWGILFIENLMSFFFANEEICLKFCKIFVTQKFLLKEFLTPS